MEQQTLTVEQAQRIAVQAISEIINRSERLRRYQFNSVELRRENVRYWVFSAASEQLQEEGRVPGAVSACVDKVDGHVWSLEEQQRYAQSLSAIRQAVTMDSASA